MHRKPIVLLSVSVMLLSLGSGGPVQAQSQNDEARMKTLQQEAEKDALKRGQTAHAELLARQFQLPASEVEKLRSSGQGWGEVTIQLALADKLVKADPTNYPNLNVALQQIGTMRNDGMGWGNISKELGFKLGPVVSDVKHSLKDLRTEEFKNGKIDKTEIKQERRVELADRVQRLERPERPQRPERPERPEKPERKGR
jgi:hypothetical protein